MGLEAVATPTKNEVGKKPVEAGFSSQGVLKNEHPCPNGLVRHSEEKVLFRAPIKNQKGPGLQDLGLFVFTGPEIMGLEAVATPMNSERMNRGSISRKASHKNFSEERRRIWGYQNFS